MRNIIKLATTFLVGLFLFLFIVKETGFEVIIDSVRLFFDRRGFFIVLTTFIIMLLGAVRWREVLRATGENVSLITVLSYHIKGFTVDYLTPFAFLGGEAVRIFLMEKEVGLKKSAFSSVVDKIMGISAHFLFLLVGVSFFIFYGTAQHSMLIFYSTGMVALIFFLLFLFYFQALRKKSFLKLIFRFSKGMRNFFKNSDNGRAVVEVEKDIMSFFSSSKEEFLKGMILGFVINFFLALRVFLIVYFIAGSTNLLFVIIIYGLVILSMILPLPAAIGGMEVVLGVGFSMFGLSFAQGVMTAIILRSAELSACLVGIILFLKMSVSSFIKQFNAFLGR